MVKSIVNYDDLVLTIGERKPGDTVPVEILRDGQSMTKEVTLVSKKEAYGDRFQHLKEQYEIEVENMLEDGELVFPGGENVFKIQTVPGTKMQVHKWKKDKAFDNNRPFLGVSMEQSEVNGENSGIVVDKVIEGSAAETMGIKNGDRILKINGTDMNSMDAVIEYLGSREVGDAVEVTVDRDGAEKTLTGELQSRSEGFPAREYKYFFREDSNGETEEVIRVIIEVADLTEEEARDLSKKAGTDLNSENNLALERVVFMPNPNDGQFEVQFSLPEVGTLRMWLFDANGRKVSEQKIKGFQGGEFRQEFDIREEPNGIYFLKIEQKGKQFNKKIVKSN